MEAKDTVKKTDPHSEGICCPHCGEEFGIESRIEIAREAQAEISFRAGMQHGIWLFAWWKDGVQYVGTTGTTLKDALKEWGI